MSEPKKDTPAPASASPPETERVAMLVRLADGRRFAVGVGGLGVGRQQGIGLVLMDQTVSRHHADLRYESGRYVLYDHSANGTRVNGKLVAAAQSLRHGDSVKFGQVEFRFEVRNVLKEHIDSLLTSTQPSQVPKASTVRMKGARPPRGWKRFRKRRWTIWQLVSLFVLLVVAAGLAVYRYSPQLFDQLIGHR